MEGNSRLPGIATEPRHRARAVLARAAEDLDAALHWAKDACVPGEYSETLLPAQLWAIEKAAAALDAAERHLVAVMPRLPRPSARYVSTSPARPGAVLDRIQTDALRVHAEDLAYLEWAAD